MTGSCSMSNDIATWIARGLTQAKEYLLVVVDDFSCDTYPIFVASHAKALVEFNRINGHSMQRVREVYDLTGVEAVKITLGAAHV